LSANSISIVKVPPKGTRSELVDLILMEGFVSNLSLLQAESRKIPNDMKRILCMLYDKSKVIPLPGNQSNE
jgi:hypothetical protein